MFYIEHHEKINNIIKKGKQTKLTRCWDLNYLKYLITTIQQLNATIQITHALKQKCEYGS